MLEAEELVVNARVAALWESPLEAWEEQLLEAEQGAAARPRMW